MSQKPGFDPEHQPLLPFVQMREQRLESSRELLADLGGDRHTSSTIPRSESNALFPDSSDYLRNLLTTVPKSAQPWVATLVRTIFDQDTAESVRAQHAWVIDALEAKYPAACAHLDTAREDLLAFAAFPRETWRQIWSNNPQERLNKEIRRRTDVVGIFPDRAAIICLVGAVLAEQTDEWSEARRYMGLDILAKARLRLLTGDTPAQKPIPQTLTA
ncbi:hypothetical protein Misp01_83310 [Microtetraspora sp. NBRC 13810]|nr:hypothetical protein Misp01_83310 [Microtetraspora sp. NBRC 13810]